MATDTPTKAEKDLKSLVQASFDHSVEYFEDRRRNLERYEGIRSKRENRQKKYDHEYISTAGAEMIEQKAAFTTEAITNAGGKMYDISAYNNYELSRDAQATTEVLNYFMNNIPLAEVGYMAHKNLYLYGTMVLEVYHKTVTKKAPNPNSTKLRLKVGDDGDFGSVAATDFIEEDEIKQPFIRQVRLNNFWPDPNPTDGTLDTCRWIVTRQLLTKEAIKANKKKFALKNLDKAFDSNIPERFDFYQFTGGRKGLRKRYAEYDIESIVKRNKQNEANKANPICEVITIYRPGTVQYMVNGVIVSDERIIYPGIRYPFVVFRNQPMEGEFFGRPDLELVKNNIDFHEEMINLIHDKYLMNLKPIIFVDGLNMDSDQIEKYKKAEAGEVITLDSFTSEGIKEFAQTPPDPSTIAFAETFLNEVKKALAINPLMEAESPGSGIRTEGSLQMFQRIGSTRMQTQLNIITKGWEDIGRCMLRMAKIFADRELYLTITGPLGDTVEGFVNPEELDENAKFKVKLSSIADPNKSAKVSRMFKYVEMCKSMDDLGLFRAEQALAETAEYMDDFHDPVSLWETDPGVIRARFEMAARRAGKERAHSSTAFPTLSEAQSQQPQEPQQVEQAPQTMTEGQAQPQIPQ